jgi:hypothetical protein
VKVSECITGRDMLWKSFARGLVRVLVGFIVTSEPMSEAHNPSQEALRAVNIV